MCSPAEEGALYAADHEGRRANLLVRLDPRLKLAFTLLALLVVTGTQKTLLPLAALALAVTALRLGGYRPGRRLRPALLVAGMVFLSQLLWHGQTPLFALRLGGITLVLYREGAAQGLLLAARVLAGMSLLVWFTATTGMQQMLFAARWFHVPAPLLEILTVAYRYVFVLLEEMQRIRQAQVVRLGHSGWWRTVQAYGTLGGMVILRVFTRSEALYQSMLCRGYRDSLAVTYEGRFTYVDALGGLAMGMLLFLGLALG